MNEFAIAIFSNIVLAGVLALLAAGVTRVWRNPFLAHALWLLVLIKLVTPPLIELRAPVLLSERAQSPSDAVSEPDLVVVSMKPAPEIEMPLQEPTRMFPAASPGGSEMSEEIAGASDASSHLREPIPWTRWVFSVWAAGVVLFIAIAAVHWRWSKVVLRAAKPAPRQLQMQTSLLAESLGLKACPRVAVSRLVSSPLVTVHGRRPVFLLPADLLAELGEDQVTTVIAHELSHLRRGDRWVFLFQYFVLAVHWWNPVAWWASRRIRQATEQCCDAMVVRAFPDKRRSYGQALLRTADFQIEHEHFRPVAGIPFGSHPITTRIRGIMKKSDPYRMNRFTWLAVCLVGLAALPVAVVVGERPVSDESPGESPPSPLPDTVSVKDPRTTLDELIRKKNQAIARHDAALDKIEQLHRSSDKVSPAHVAAAAREADLAKAAVDKSSAELSEFKANYRPPVKNTLSKILADARFVDGTSPRSVMEGVEGKFVGLYFTADWCGPCKPFTRELIQFRDANAGKFAFIMMSLDHSRKDQLAYLKQSAMNAPAVIFDDPVTKRLMQQRGLRQIPALLVFGPGGRLLTPTGMEQLNPRIMEVPQPVTGVLRNDREFSGWQALVKAHRGGVDDWNARRTAAVAEIFDRYRKTLPIADDLSKHYLEPDAKERLRKPMSKFGESLVADWAGKRDQLEQLRQLSTEIGQVYTKFVHERDEKANATIGPVFYLVDPCLEVLGRGAAATPELLPFFEAWMDKTNYDTHKYSWATHVVTAAAIEDHPPAVERLESEFANRGIGRINIMDALQAPCRRGDDKAIKLLGKLYEHEPYFSYLVLDGVEPAALKGNPQAVRIVKRVIETTKRERDRRRAVEILEKIGGAEDDE